MPAELEDVKPKAASSTTGRRRTKVKDLIAQYHHDETLCRYKNKLCTNPRARKRRGGLHTFCDAHREAANRNQRRLDMRKRIMKRQLETMAANPDQVFPLDEAVDYSSPHSPGTMVDSDYMSPCSDASADSDKPATAGLEPSSTPVALKEEDIYTLRWLFAVDETSRQQQQHHHHHQHQQQLRQPHEAHADVEMAYAATTPVPQPTHIQWV